MRDIEFLPDWYIKTHRRKRLLTLQIVLFVGLGLYFAGWSAIKAQKVVSSSNLLDQHRNELQASADRVKERQTMQDLRIKLQTQSKVDASLGLNVESARILSLLASIMPERSSLSEITINTEERQLQVASGTPLQSANGNVAREISRTLRVTIKGIAPGNEDVAAILEGLGSKRFCQELKLDHSTDRIDKDRVMREFQIDFSIPLDAPRGKV